MNIAEIKSSLALHLKEIGRGTFGCPTPCGNHDPAIHAYMIDTMCASFFKKQRENSLVEVLLACDSTRIDRAIEDACTDKAKQSASLLQDKLYEFTLDVKTPASTLNVTQLRSTLNKDGRYTSKEIEAMFAKCTSMRTPAKSFSAVAI